MALMNASAQNVIIALTITEIPRVVRLVRPPWCSAFASRHSWEASRAVGAGIWRVLLRHVTPNTVAPLIVQGTYICASAVIFEAYLSFLGAGTPPNIPSWGNIMAEGRTYVADRLLDRSLPCACSWRSRSWPSTCSATACATRWTPSWRGGL